MPYFDLFQDEEQNQGLGTGLKQAFGGSLQGQTLSPASPVSAQNQTASGASPGAAPSGVAGDSGSSFVNFDRYVNANKDAATASAGNVAGSVSDTAEKAAGGLGDLYGRFSGDVTAGTGHAAPTPVRAQSQGIGAMELDGRGNTTPAASSNLASNGDGRTPTTGQFSSGTPAPKGSPPSTAVSDPTAPPPPAAPKPPTRDELVTGSQQVYRGPTSLAQTPGFDAVTGQITNAASQVNALGSKEGLSGLLAKNFGSGSVGSGGNELDSLLLGRMGGDKFGEVKKGYGDLESRVGRAVGDSEKLAQNASELTSGYAGQYKGLLDKFDKEAKDKVDAQTAQQTEAQRQLAAAKKTADYFAPRHEDTVRDIGNALDPTHWAGELFGFRGLNDRATDAAEKYGRENMDMENDSRHVHGLPAHVMEAFSKMFPNLSDDEIKTIEKMSQTQQIAWITNKANEMGMK